MPGRPTIDRIVTLNTVIQSRKDFQRGLFGLLEIDLKAAFDSVDRKALWKLLRSLGPHSKVVDLMEAQYTDTCTLWGKETAPFLFSPITCQSTFYVHNFWHSDTWMNFPSAAYFTYFVDSGTENQLNILFVYMVADDNINYLRECIMLYNKRDMILIHNLHVLKRYGVKKLVKSFHKRNDVCAVWIILLNRLEKPAQQTNSRAVADLTHHKLLRTLMQLMIWCSVRRVYQRHTKLPARSPGKLAFCGGQWDASQRHSVHC